MTFEKASHRSLLAVTLIASLVACSPQVTTPTSSPYPDKPYVDSAEEPSDELEEFDELDELDELDALDRMEQSAPNNPQEIRTDNAAPRWSERSFSGNSHYTITTLDSQETIRGETDGQASVLYRQERIDVSKNPYLSWDWKIRDTYDIDDERSKLGDDFPARVYVVVQTGLLPWDTLAINYVWSSSSTTGTDWRNPFSDKAVMLALNSGNQLRGQWISQSRDVVADFQRYHNIDIAEIDGYAYMIDGDNSGSKGVSWVRNIRFSSAP